MQISCAFPPSSDAVDHAVLAETLGYERAWFYDSPALYGDVWVTLARVAERTSLRHPMTQAAAIATVEQLAPGRVAVALGTGFTGRVTMGQSPLTWAYMERYIRQLRALLAGETVEIDGAMAKMIPPPGLTEQRRFRTGHGDGGSGMHGREAAEAGRRL